MTENRRRRRVNLQKNPNAIPAIVDELEFIENRCSLKARKIGDRIENTNIDFWIDKHYHIRHQHGDEDGKREGIELEKVYEIVQESLKHLMVYSATVKNFTFLNHNAPKGGRNLRIVCQKFYKENKTNVTIEGHLISLNEFEITIVTAIQKNEYQPSDGQYAVELLGAGNSTLIHCNRGNLNEISHI
jgi:hypothetical protein